MSDEITEQQINEIALLRQGNAVRRAHTLRHLGEYTVGQHSADALSLLLLLHPNPSAHLMRAVLWHDVAEAHTGDVPAPAKWRSPDLKNALDAAEDAYLRAQLPTVHRTLMELTADEREWLNAVDSLELMLWAVEQVALGNSMAMTVVGRVMAHLQGKPGTPRIVRSYIDEHLRLDATRR